MKSTCGPTDGWQTRVGQGLVPLRNRALKHVRIVQMDSDGSLAGLFALLGAEVNVERHYDLVYFEKDHGLPTLVPLGMSWDSGSALSPAETFEAHSLALDEGRYADAAELSMCPPLGDDALDAMMRDLGPRGFVGIFPVAGVWMFDTGDEAILELGSHANLPKIQPMTKVDGTWLLDC